MKKAISCGLALVACMAVCLLSYAAVQFDNEGNPVFVGKGDIQNLYGWNNNALQACANYKTDGVDNCLEFRVGIQSEISWRCTNSNNQNIQTRTRTESELKAGNLTGRQNNQVTGFHISVTDDIVGSESTGPALGSCPSGPWSFNDDCSDKPTCNGQGYWTSAGGSDGLWVRDIRPGFDGAWYEIPVTP